MAAVSIHGLPNTNAPCQQDDLLGCQCALLQAMDHDFPDPVMTIPFPSFSAFPYIYEWPYNPVMTQSVI